MSWAALSLKVFGVYILDLGWAGPRRLAAYMRLARGGLAHLFL